jgi:hypothetical protein
MPKPLTPEQTDAITNAVFAGRKIEAIKLYREAADVELVEAKQFVERLEEELRARHPDRFATAPNKKGCLVAVAMVVAMAIGFLLAAMGWGCGGAMPARSDLAPGGGAFHSAVNS